MSVDGGYSPHLPGHRARPSGQNATGLDGRLYKPEIEDGLNT